MLCQARHIYSYMSDALISPTRIPPTTCGVVITYIIYFTIYRTRTVVMVIDLFLILVAWMSAMPSVTAQFTSASQARTEMEQYVVAIALKLSSEYNSEVTSDEVISKFNIL